jgi:hypothetical protein
MTAESCEGGVCGMSERAHRREELAREKRSRGRAACDPGRHVFGYLTGATALLALAVGSLVTIVDSRDFSRSGPVGRRKTEERYAASEEQTRTSLRLLLERLEAIEQKLDQRRG